MPPGIEAGLSAATVTVPHAIGLGVLAFAPIAADYPLAAMALWSAALPGALMTLLWPRNGVIYAPSTVVALLFAAILASVAKAGWSLGLNAGQVLAVAGATVALAFGFQWLFGMLRLASLARFLPLSVTHGFAAGVGLSMVVAQGKGGFGAGVLAWDARLAWHAAIALAVAVLAWLVQRRWPRVPGLLPAVAAISLLAVATGMTGWLTPAVPLSGFEWPMLPAWSGVPWLILAGSHGVTLVSLALLMALVNSLEVMVFSQELELEHGLRSDSNRVLRREGLLGVACGILGLIPASTSSSRSRIVLRHGGGMSAGQAHAAVLLLVAFTGHLWLPWVPKACLVGALLLAGLTQVPLPLWSRHYARSAPGAWGQAWLVALVFATEGGVGALIIGLVMAVLALLRSSANSALRRTSLDGQLRSRRLRRAASERWLAERMNRVAVFELQGALSFGVAAHLAEQVRIQLEVRHDRVILDAGRVPFADATALAQLRALGRDLGRQGRELAVCGLSQSARERLAGAQVKCFADVDRALEWAEDALLDERSAQERMPRGNDLLGEVGEGLGDAARRHLEGLLQTDTVASRSSVFLAGDTDTQLVVVTAGRVTIATAWPPENGLRLAVVSQGMTVGEMAFLSGAARTACAGAEEGPAQLVRLARADFDAWAAGAPADALVLMANLAQIGNRRLAATTRQLRAAL